MAIDSGKLWTLLRRGGFWIAVSSLASTIIFGVIDNLTGGLIPTISDTIRDRWSPPPKYLVFLTSPVELDAKKITIEPVPKEDQRSVQLGEVKPHYIPVTGPPGEYWVTLTRADGRFLPARVTLKRGSNSDLDTSDGKWAQPEVVSKGVAEIQSPGPVKPGTEVLREVRWTATQSDRDQISVARTRETKTILATALSEVGTGEVQDAGSAARIYEYWSVIPILRKMNNITPENLGPWGGAFLTWVVMKSNVDPPESAAAYNSWAGWAKSVPVDNPEPGTVALFETKAVPGIRGKYLAGVVLRKRSDCTEIITGNVINRVVIACVGLPISTLRHP
jgi:hypothetical protein